MKHVDGAKQIEGYVEDTLQKFLRLLERKKTKFKFTITPCDPILPKLHRPRLYLSENRPPCVGAIASPLIKQNIANTDKNAKWTILRDTNKMY